MEAVFTKSDVLLIPSIFAQLRYNSQPAQNKILLCIIFMITASAAVMGMHVPIYQPHINHLRFGVGQVITSTAHSSSAASTVVFLNGRNVSSLNLWLFKFIE